MPLSRTILSDTSERPPQAPPPGIAGACWRLRGRAERRARRGYTLSVPSNAHVGPAEIAVAVLVAISLPARSAASVPERTGNRRQPQPLLLALLLTDLPRPRFTAGIVLDEGAGRRVPEVRQALPPGRRSLAAYPRCGRQWPDPGRRLTDRSSDLLFRQGPLQLGSSLRHPVG
jgi:hypothetical protein